MCRVGDLLPNPLYRNPRFGSVFLGVRAAVCNMFSDRTFSSTSTFEDNVYATIGKNNG